ncbi:hypothetical protein [Shewanella pneumatophori]|uniref:Uncharacterized protein n=1 Tax=Shewanella pneumatophori TaxID=314092 RepID=A0A9X1ZAV8_9GAMM|nr:hypothetical protein [Shewanella pneumatophori]MCL1138161.1 hypothetical protein [Shewanella pneumatophori]
MNEFLEILFSPYGGTAAIISVFTTFLGKLWLKTIVNKGLSEQRLELQRLQDKNKESLKELEQAHQLKVESIKAENIQNLKVLEQQHSISIENLKSESSKDLEILKLDSNNNLEKFRNDFKSEFLKHESYSAIAKDQFQSLFDKRIKTYAKLITLKNSIGDTLLDHAEELEFSSDYPEMFKNCIERICKLTQKETMYISNEIALISNSLNEIFSEILSQAKVHSMGTAMTTPMNNNAEWHSTINEAEKDVLRRIFKECSPVYDQWFKQLDKDVAKIREILDISHDFFYETKPDC